MNRTKLRRRYAAQFKRKQLGRGRYTKSKSSRPKTRQSKTNRLVKIYSPEEKLSDESITYVGTTYVSVSNMMRNPSIVDLTKSDTSLNSSFQNFDELKPGAYRPVSNSASMFTIFPTKQSVDTFSTSSEEICACTNRKFGRKSTKKRSFSVTDVTPNRSKKKAAKRVTLDAWKLKDSGNNESCLYNHDEKSIVNLNPIVKLENIADDY